MNPDSQPADRYGTEPTLELAQRLRELDGDLPEDLQTRVLDAGHTIVPALVALLEEAFTEGDGDPGWAPIHAANLLGMIGDAQAVPTLLRIVEHYEAIDGYHQEAVDALIALGEPAVEACLEAYPTASNEDLRDGIASVLSRGVIKDERVFQTLIDFLKRSPELGTMLLADYGDPKAVPVLSQMFDDLPMDEQAEAGMANHVFIELQGAIEQLGGQLTAAQLAKAERADAPRRRFASRVDEALNRVTTQSRDPRKVSSKLSNRQGSPVKSQRKLGRNERCWCGSGKKYKKCHLDLDR